MKSEVEQVLERLGNEWPVEDSLVDGVMRQIASRGVRPVPQPGWSRRATWLLAAAASLAVVAVLWSLGGNRTLYAQALEGVHRARTFRMTITVEPGEGKPAQRAIDAWYERGVGFRNEQPAGVTIGNAEYFWSHVEGAKVATRSASRGINDLVDRVLDQELGQVLSGAKYSRYAAGDRQIEGRPCQAFLLDRDRQDDPDLKTGKKRVIILLDDRSRVARIVTEFRSGDRWVVRTTSDWRYDIPVDRALFEPHFGDEVKVVDADTAFDKFVDLGRAVHREERSGLWFAIHRVERFEGGGVFVVSSVRGTAETLKQFPLTRRSLQTSMPPYVDGPAVNLAGFPHGYPSFSGYLALELASANHQGIHVRWSVLIPEGAPPTRFDDGAGRVRIPVGVTPQGEFARARFTDAQGLLRPLAWDVVVDAPEPRELPTLEAIARKVHADVSALEAVPFRGFCMGREDMYRIRLDRRPETTTAAQFSRAVSGQVRSWMEADVEFQLEGQFAAPRPRGFVPSEDEPVISLVYNPEVGDATLARVARCDSLKRLYLDGTRITDAGLRHLGGLRELRALSLAATPITDAGLKELERLPALRTLDVRGTSATTDGIARIKAAIPNLEVSSD